MKLTRHFFIGACLLMAVSCSEDKFTQEIPLPDDTENPGVEEPTIASRDEQYRPQIHFTPASNWMNDPNGMVYADGLWHLYYQYNPKGNDWGNMSWGHAVSTDLMHWQEKPVAMTPNQHGDIFSGSAIYDKDNVAGFGEKAILAFYTASGDHQQQCLAYSVDGGISFTQYEGNPIIPNNNKPDFRDPKVFYHEETGQYIMALAKGWDYSIEFWGSSNLKEWKQLSEFRTENGRMNKGQWECPDLFKVPYKGGEKWILIVSLNPGGPMGGSGTAYFVGDFDGKNFVADDLSYPLWLDWGPDNYAGVTWSNSPDGRKIYIGWMNNWNYAGAVPCNPWRSAMTLPRELTLTEMNGSPVLGSSVVKELEEIAGPWTKSEGGLCLGGDAYEMVIKLDSKENNTFTLTNSKGENIGIQVKASAQKIIVNRSAPSGATSFNGLFTLPSISADYDNSEDLLELHLIVDHSSVEIFTADGKTALTCLVFPSEPYDRITGVNEMTYRTLSSIW